MISFDTLLAWVLVTNTPAYHERVDSSALRETLRDMVGMASSEERTGSVRVQAVEIPSTSRPQIEASRPCEEASCSHRREAGNLCNTEKVRLEKCGHDIHRFILHKKASVPKLSLNQAIESFLAGKSPVLSSPQKDPPGSVQHNLYAFDNDRTVPNSALNERGKSLIPTRIEKNQHDGNIIVIPETSSDDDSEDDVWGPANEMFAAEKHHLSSSQVDRTKQGLCMKCGKGGQLLTCGVIGCCIAFHESCLGSVRLDKAHQFYCPFCSFMRASLEYSQARRNVIRAKKNLDFSCEHPIEGLNGSSSRAKHDEQNEDTNFSGQAEKQASVGRCDDSTSVERVNDEQIVDSTSHAAVLNEQMEDFQSTEPHAAFGNCNLSPEEGNTSHGEHDAAVAQQKGEISVGDDHQNIQEPDRDEQVKDASDHDMGNQALLSQNSGRHPKRVRDANTESIENKMRFTPSPGKRRKHAYKAKRYSNPLMPPGRRTILLWTTEEEAALKEGMQKFAPKDGGNIPWRTILEFGCCVFHKTREPSDLKDKWRNIRIREGLQH